MSGGTRRPHCDEERTLHTDLQLGLAGIGAGAAIAMLALGLVVVYRGSGVLNFAQGAIATVGTYTYLKARLEWEVPLVASIVIGIAASTVLGLLFQQLVMRPLRHAPLLARVVATLGLLVFVQSAIRPIFGNKNPNSPTIVGDRMFTLPFGSPKFVIAQNRLFVLVVVAGVTTLLWAVYRWTRFGIATRAAADNERATSLMGYSPVSISLANWAIGSALAGAAGILLSPLVQVTPVFYTQLLVAAIAAALLGGLRSFGVTFLGGLLIGVVQSVMLAHASDLEELTNLGGWTEALPFFIVAGVIIFRGRAIPLRDAAASDPLPLAGSPSRRAVTRNILIALVAGVAWFLLLPPSWSDPMTASLIVALLCLSLVVVTGYVGQISLAQMTFAGVGGFAASKFASDLDLPFPLPLVLGALVAAPIGLVIGLPALRVRGLNLAVVTLGAAVAFDTIIFADRGLTGGATGSRFPAAHLGPVDLNGLDHPRRYGIFALVIVLLVAVAVTEIRRRHLGMSFLAVRANERGASGAGLSVPKAKLAAFCLAAALAGLAGALMGYRSLQVSLNSFVAFQSVFLLSLAYLGGISSVGGAFVGGLLAAGGVMDHVLRLYIFSDSDLSNTWLPMFTGLSLMVTVVTYPGGLVTLGDEVRSRVAGLRSRRRRTVAPDIHTAGDAA